MGNTSVTALQHYLAPTGALADVPGRARLLAEYFASILVDATTNLDDAPTFGVDDVPVTAAARGS